MLALSCPKKASTFIPTASGPGSAKSIKTSTTSTPGSLRCPREPDREGSAIGAMKETVPEFVLSKSLKTHGNRLTNLDFSEISLVEFRPHAQDRNIT